VLGAIGDTPTAGPAGGERSRPTTRIGVNRVRIVPTESAARRRFQDDPALAQGRLPTHRGLPHLHAPRDRLVSPRTGQEHEFYVFDSVNWVNVIAVTPDRQLVMVEQYRHGSARWNSKSRAG